MPESKLQKRITAKRQQQPEEELERKWNKAKGRHSNAFWCAEWLDLAYARAAKTWVFFNPGAKLEDFWKDNDKP